MRRFFLQLALVVVTCSQSAPLLAQERARVALAFRSEEPACPGRDVLMERVLARLGSNPFAETGDVVAEVTIRHVDGGLEGHVALRYPNHEELGERTLQVPTTAQCEELVHALAAVLAVVIDEAPPPVAPPSVAVTVVAAPEPAAAPPVEAPVPASPPEPLLFHAAIGVQGDVGFTPLPSLGGHLALGLGGTHWSVHIEGYVGARLASASLGEDTLDAFHFGGTLALCTRIDIVFGCVTGGAGGLQAKVNSTSNPSEQLSVYAHVGARIGLEIPLVEGLYLAPRIDVSAIPLRVGVLVDDTLLWAMSPVAGTLGVDLQARFE